MLIALKVVVGLIDLMLAVGLGLRGMFLGAGTLCALGLRSEEGRWLQAAAVLIGAVAVGRALGLVLDGYATQLLVFLVVELVMVGALLTTAARMARA